MLHGPTQIINPFARRAFGYGTGSSGAGGPAPNSAEAQQFYDRLFTPPTPGSAEETRWNTFIDGCVADGVWAKLDHLSLLCAGDNEGDSLVNLIQANYNAGRAQTSGGAVFTLHEGFSAGGALRSLTTNFNPSTATTPHFTRNDGMVGVWIYSTAQVNQPSIIDNATPGAAGGAGNVVIYPKWSDNKAYFNVNGTEAGPTNSGDSSGFYIAQRTGANAAAHYRNDALLGSDASASKAVANTTIVAYCTHSVRVMVIGASLDATQRTALYNRLVTFITAVTGGVP